MLPGAGRLSRNQVQPSARLLAAEHRAGPERTERSTSQGLACGVVVAR